MIHFLKTIYRKSKLFISKGNKVIGSDNVIYNKGIMHNVELDVIGNGNHIEIHPGATLLNCKVYIRGNQHKLIIGENCSIVSGEFWFEDENCTISIGSKTTIESGHLAATEYGRSIVLGEDCMLSTRIEIRTGDSHSIISNETQKRINPAADVVLGRHVWIGSNASILKGVTIGDNSVVATGSVLTQAFPSNVIIGGVPAKIIKENISWKRERINERQI